MKRKFTVLKTTSLSTNDNVENNIEKEKEESLQKKNFILPKKFKSSKTVSVPNTNEKTPIIHSNSIQATTTKKKPTFKISKTISIIEEEEEKPKKKFKFSISKTNEIQEEIQEINMIDNNNNNNNNLMDKLYYEDNSENMRFAANDEDIKMKNLMKINEKKERKKEINFYQNPTQVTSDSDEESLNQKKKKKQVKEVNVVVSKKKSDKDSFLPEPLREENDKEQVTTVLTDENEERIIKSTKAYTTMSLVPSDFKNRMSKEEYEETRRANAADIEKKHSQLEKDIQKKIKKNPDSDEAKIDIEYMKEIMKDKENPIPEQKTSYPLPEERNKLRNIEKILLEFSQSREDKRNNNEQFNIIQEFTNRVNADSNQHKTFIWDYMKEIDPELTDFQYSKISSDVTKIAVDLPVYTFEQEEALLRESKAGERNCLYEDKCVGMSDIVYKFFADKLRQPEMTKWTPFILTERLSEKDLKEGKLPEIKRRCVLCDRKDKMFYYDNARGQGTTTKKYPCIFQTYQNAVLIDGEYDLNDCILSTKDKMQGIIAPVVAYVPAFLEPIMTKDGLKGFTQSGYKRYSADDKFWEKVMKDKNF